MQTEIARVVPWPSYDDFGVDWWDVVVVDRTKTVRLAFSRRLNRFAKSTDLRFLRRGNPKAFAAASACVEATFETGHKAAKTGHSAENAGQTDGTNPRACARSIAPNEEVSHCPIVPNNGTGHTVGRDTLIRGTGQTGEARPSHPACTGNWTHLSALNLIADHDAGIAVDAEKLKRARVLLGRSE